MSATDHVMSRLDIEVDAKFDDFRARFEGAVPPFAAERMGELVTARASWDEMVAAVADSAPHGFMIYWSIDVLPIMSLAGHARPCVEYLMGNHVIAERMYRHHSGVMLYAPLRIALYVDARGRTIFSIDQPSTAFAGFGDPAIAEVGVELDRLLAGLLTTLDVGPPAALGS